MAAVISDYISDSSYFQQPHTMIAGPSKESSTSDTHFIQQISNLRDAPSSPRSQIISQPIGTLSSVIRKDTRQEISKKTTGVENKTQSRENQVVTPTLVPKPIFTRQKFMSQENITRPVLPHNLSPKTPSQDVKTRKGSCFSLSSPNVILPRTSVSSDDIKGYVGNKIKVRNLAHIRSFACDEFPHLAKQTGCGPQECNGTKAYDISGMPTTDVIEMVAGLLTKIVTTNDRLNTNRSRTSRSAEITGYPSELSSSASAFHGKNVPDITILSYFSRIHKFCPTTYEVFLSLLVYFDRMTERVNKLPVKLLGVKAKDHLSEYIETPEVVSDTPTASLENINRQQSNSDIPRNTHAKTLDINQPEACSTRLFVVDSYNIHRLVIAAVTCASKYFSDVFYTNSRYAKVGGLPLPELNHLELQFLLLNDFRLFVPVEELETYGSMLVEFYAREVVSQKHGSTDLMGISQPSQNQPVVS